MPQPEGKGAMSDTQTEDFPTTHGDQELLDIQAIRSLLERYAFAMDRRDTELMRTCFTPDADLSYFGGLKKFNRDSFSDQLVSGSRHSRPSITPSAASESSSKAIPRVPTCTSSRP